MPHAMATQGSLDSDRLSSHSSTLPAGDSGPLHNGKRHQEDDYTLGPLPPLWEKAYTASGEVYFIDHNTGTSHWLDPRLARVRKRSLGECAEDELPFGWERVTDDRYGAYYVDHIHRRTQYENPVLQAARLRAEKLSMENGERDPVSAPCGELRGEKFTVTLTKGPQGLGFTLIGADSEASTDTEGYLQIRSIVPHGPAWVDGELRPGDVLMSVDGHGVRGATHAQVAQIFQSIPPGSRVTLMLCRGYPLAFDSADPHTRVLSTLAVDHNNQPAPADNAAMQHLTESLRYRFNLRSPRTDQPGLTEDEGRDEPDRSPPHQHHEQRRMLSRSFDLDELGERETVPPRCPSADNLLSVATDTNGAATPSEAGKELVLTLRRGSAGFGFTIADSVHGQKVKKVLDRSRCAGLREGDLLLQIGDTDVRHAPHLRVVQALKECPAMHETTLRVWRRAAPPRAPRSRSATRPHSPSHGNSNGQLGRSKTPTAEQLRSPMLQPVDPLHNRLNGEATYAVPEHKRESLLDRRRRSSTPGGRLSVPTVAPWTDDQPSVSQWTDNQPSVGQWSESQPPPVPSWNDKPPVPPWNDNHPPVAPWNDNQASVAPWNENQASVAPWPRSQDDQPIPSLDRPHPNPDRLHLQRNQLSPLHINAIGANADNRGHSNQPYQSEPGASWSDNWLDNSSSVRSWAENSRKWDDNTSRSWETNGVRYPGGGETWTEVGTPTVRVDTDTYWHGNGSVADSSDNGGFPEDGVLAMPTTAAVGGQVAVDNRRPLSPSNSAGRLRSHSPSNASANGRMVNSPARLRQHSPPRLEPMSPRSFGGNYQRSYPQVEAALGGADPEADVLVRLAPGTAGFGFRIVGGTEDGSRVAVGHVVPGGPAEGLLRAGDLLTSVDGVSLAGASHARAVSAVCQAAQRGHVTLGVRHNRADIAPNVPPPHPHQPNMSGEAVRGYNIVHPAPLYPPPHQHPLHPHHPYSSGAGSAGAWQYESGGGGVMGVGSHVGAGEPYDVTVSRGDGEGFGFVVISSANKATSTIGQLIANSPAALCGLLRVGDTILAINGTPVTHLPHPDVVALIKRSGRRVTLTVRPPD